MVALIALRKPRRLTGVSSSVSGACKEASPSGPVTQGSTDGSKEARPARLTDGVALGGCGGTVISGMCARRSRRRNGGDRCGWHDGRQTCGLETHPVEIRRSLTQVGLHADGAGKEGQLHLAVVLGRQSHCAHEVHHLALGGVGASAEEEERKSA